MSRGLFTYDEGLVREVLGGGKEREEGVDEGVLLGGGEEGSKSTGSKDEGSSKMRTDEEGGMDLDDHPSHDQPPINFDNKDQEGDGLPLPERVDGEMMVMDESTTTTTTTTTTTSQGRDMDIPEQVGGKKDDVDVDLELDLDPKTISGTSIERPSDDIPISNDITSTSTSASNSTTTSTNPAILTPNPNPLHPPNPAQLPTKPSSRPSQAQPPTQPKPRPSPYPKTHPTYPSAKVLALAKKLAEKRGMKLVLPDHPMGGKDEVSPGEGGFLLVVKDEVGVGIKEEGGEVKILGEGVGMGTGKEMGEEVGGRLIGNELGSGGSQPSLIVHHDLAGPRSEGLSILAPETGMTTVPTDLNPTLPISHALPLALPVSPIPTNPTPTSRQGNKKKGRGRWAGHVKNHHSVSSRAETPVRVGTTSMGGGGHMGGVGLGAGLGGAGGMGVGVGVVEVVDDELVKERKRKDFGNGIGNSSWWCVFTRIGVVLFVVEGREVLIGFRCGGCLGIIC